MGYFLALRLVCGLTCACGGISLASGTRAIATELRPEAWLTWKDYSSGILSNNKIGAQNVSMPWWKQYGKCRYYAIARELQTKAPAYSELKWLHGHSGV